MPVTPRDSASRSSAVPIPRPRSARSTARMRSHVPHVTLTPAKSTHTRTSGVPATPAPKHFSSATRARSYGASLARANSSRRRGRSAELAGRIIACNSEVYGTALPELRANEPRAAAGRWEEGGLRQVPESAEFRRDDDQHRQLQKNGRRGRIVGDRLLGS